MYNPINSIIRSCKKEKDEPLNILTFVAHERYEPNLCLTDHNFYSLITEGTRTWNEQYSPIPDNYFIFKDRLPIHLINEIDIIISHNPFVHIPLAIKLNMNVPIINIFHTMPPHGWNNNSIHPQHKQLFDYCTEHVYISDFNKHSWGYGRGEVIYHGLDTELFKPNNNTTKEHRILTVANDYVNRDRELGFTLWRQIADSFSMFPVGKTPGLSEPAKNIQQLIKYYQQSLIFLNTSMASPLPMSLMEAMSCGCACVSTATCMIPDVVEHGQDGYLCTPNKPEKFKEYIQLLLDNPDHAYEIGQNARKKIEKMFSLTNFIDKWNNVLTKVLHNDR